MTGTSSFTDRLSVRYRGASDDDLLVLADLVESVPDELVDFLTASNGGAIIPGDLALATPWGPRHITVDEFWPTHARRPGGSAIPFATLSMRTEGMLPPTVLAIAGDVESNALCMSAEPDTFGHIYLWDDTRSHPNLAQTDRLEFFMGFMAPIATSLDELAELFVDEQTAIARVSAIPTPTSVPSTGIERPATSPPRRDPVALADVDPDDYVFLYQHNSGQPDVVAARPLEAAYENSQTPLGPTWGPLAINWFRPDTNSMDLIDAHGQLLLRPAAVDAIGDVLTRFGELLPIETETGPLALFRCTTVLDALEPSVALTENRPGFVHLGSYEFQADVIADAGIFTVPDQPLRPTTFYTRPIVEAILSAGIRLLPFTPIAQRQSLTR